MPGEGVVIWGREHDSTTEGDKAIIAAAPTMLEMLRELEWAGNAAGACPLCERYGEHGKEYDGTPCRLNSLLAPFRNP